MRKAFWVLGFCVLMVVKTSMACSVSINDVAQKNFLAAHGASYLNIDFSTVTATTVSNYSKVFDGTDEYYCPQYLETQGVVKFTYKPAANENCEAQVTVSRRHFIGDELPEGPVDDVDFTEFTASCSTSSTRVIRPERPVRPVPQVRPVRPKP